MARTTVLLLAQLLAAALAAPLAAQVDIPTTPRDRDLFRVRFLGRDFNVSRVGQPSVRVAEVRP